jgi:hypothetical protein
MTQSKAPKPYRFRYDGAILPAWLPAAKRADGAMLMGRLSPQRRDHARQYLDQMRILRTSGRWWPRPSKRWRGSCPERQINPRSHELRRSGDPSPEVGRLRRLEASRLTDHHIWQIGLDA